MRRTAGLITALVLLTVSVLSGCVLSPIDRGDKLSVVTTSFPPYDFVRAVTGDSADITMLLQAGAEAHSYEPVPLDIAKIQNCDVFVYIGGEGEVWVDKILDSLDTSDITVIRLFDYIDPLEEEEVEGAMTTTMRTRSSMSTSGPLRGTLSSALRASRVSCAKNSRRTLSSTVKTGKAMPEDSISSTGISRKCPKMRRTIQE